MQANKVNCSDGFYVGLEIIICEELRSRHTLTVAGNGNELTSDEELFFFVSSREAINAVCGYKDA